MSNRVLTISEVLALEDGAEVWVECPGYDYFSGTHTKHGSKLRALPKMTGWFSLCALGGFGTLYRVWTGKPTDAEREAEAWQS